jgi:predicted small secreted protein
MKKLFLAVAVLAMAFTACNSVDSAIDDLAAGCKANDKEAVKEAIKGLQGIKKKEKSKLTDQEEMLLLEAIEDCDCYWVAALEVTKEEIMQD